MKFEKGKILKDLTTLKIGGRAKLFKQVRTLNELQKILNYCREQGIRYMVLGKGSNVLFDDRGFDGVIILNKIIFCKSQADIFYVGAGYSFSLLGNQTTKQGWKGLGFAAGIPGSVGGAIYMNAAAQGEETFQPLIEVTYVTNYGEVEYLPKNQLKWSYRYSSFQEQELRGGGIAAAKFQLIPSKEARINQLKSLQIRLNTQPYNVPSAGCIFRNTSRSSAGSLIEKCSLKGYKIGGAEVSHQHANFIVNRGGATASEVKELIQHLQEVVYRQTGEKLELEIQILSF